MTEPVVTVCIPTWQAEAFIDQTLGCARNQTYPHLRILVSVDHSNDRTTDLCQRHAREDRRVEVFAQGERLGWARNINFLLDQVTSEYFFIYPHDDLIDPHYVEVLLNRLQERPDAASVQCRVLHVRTGGAQILNLGRAHEGPVSHRFIASLLDPLVGDPLRSLIRAKGAGNELRFPDISGRGFCAHTPFQAQLFAAGPALHVPETLYWRQSLRSGGLVDSWTTVPIGDLVSDQRANAAACLRLIEHRQPAPAEKAVMIFGVYCRLLRELRRYEIRQGGSALVGPRVVSDAFAFNGVPSEVNGFPREIREWVVAGYANLVGHEALHHARRGQLGDALARLGTLRLNDAVIGMPSLGRRYLGRMRQRVHPAALPAELRTRVSG